MLDRKNTWGFDAKLRRPAEEGGDTRADGKSYSTDDDRLFADLMGSLRNDTRMSFVQDFSNGGDVSSVEPSSSEEPIFGYTDSDAREFDHLMSQLDIFRGTRSPSRAGIGTYTDQDDQLFAELMMDASFSVDTPGHSSTEVQTLPESAFQYSEQDNAAFQKLMPFPADQEVEEASKFELPMSRKDQDVGPIRVVDADRERERDRKVHRAGGMNMKIRFFD